MAHVMIDRRLVKNFKHVLQKLKKLEMAKRIYKKV